VKTAEFRIENAVDQAFVFDADPASMICDLILNFGWRGVEPDTPGI